MLGLDTIFYCFCGFCLLSFRCCKSKIKVTATLMMTLFNHQCDYYYITTYQQCVIFLTSYEQVNNQRWSRGHKARGQGQGHKKSPRPRTAFPRTDTLEAKDRNARGQGHKCKCSPKKIKKKGLHKNFSGNLQKKKVFTKIFQAISTKKRFPKNFSSAPQNFNNSKNSAVLDPRTGQFSRPRGQGLDLRGQGLQNLSSRTPPL